MSGRSFYGFLEREDERSKIDRSSQESAKPSTPKPKVKHVPYKWCGTCKFAQPLVDYCPDRNLISNYEIDWLPTPGSDCTRYVPID